MISAVVEERLETGSRAKCEPGTLRLRRAREGESHVFSVAADLQPGEEVWLIPLDPRLIFNGVPVATGVATGANVETRSPIVGTGP